MKKSILALIIFSGFLLLISGIALIVISYLPLEQVTAFVASFVPDGNFRSFSTKHITRLRLAGFLSGFASLLIFTFSRRFAKYTYEVFYLIIYSIKNLVDTLRKEDKSHSITFMLIIFMAIVVRVYYLFQPIATADESRIFTMYVYDATSGIKGIMYLLTQYNEPGHHVFHTLLAYLTYKLIGNEQWTWIIRLPALCAGILIVPASYVFIRNFYNKNAALLTSAIVASSSDLIHYSTQARGYSIIGLIFLLLLILGAYNKKNNELSGWILFGILAAFGLYTIPQFLYAYGIALTWLLFSIIFNDFHHDRNHVIKNFITSILITVLFTFLFYSPILLFGTGLKSLIGDKNFTVCAFLLKDALTTFYYMFLAVVWGAWHKSVPVIIKYLFIAGFACTVFFHKKLSIHKISIAISAVVWLTTFFLVQRVACYFDRYWLYFLPVYLGLAATGIIFILRPLEQLLKEHKRALPVIISIILMLFLMGNKVKSEPILNSTQMQDIDNSGKFIEFRHIQTSTLYHIGRTRGRILVLFPSPSKNEFWNRRLQYYFNLRKFDRQDKYIIDDLDSYVSSDSKICHNLFLLSSESMPVLENLLENRGVPVSDYGVPQLIHRYKYANLYKMSQSKDCKK